MRLTDVADTKQVLRLIQSIPSKKAEPFKIWLAQVGKERIDETINLELTDELTKAWSGLDTRQYKKIKRLKKHDRTFTDLRGFYGSLRSPCEAKLL